MKCVRQPAKAWRHNWTRQSLNKNTLIGNTSRKCKINKRKWKCLKSNSKITKDWNNRIKNLSPKLKVSKNQNKVMLILKRGTRTLKIVLSA